MEKDYETCESFAGLTIIYHIGRAQILTASIPIFLTNNRLYRPSARPQRPACIDTATQAAKYQWNCRYHIS